MIFFYAMLVLIAFPNYLPFYNLGELSLLKIIGIVTLGYAFIYNLLNKNSVSIADQPQKKLFIIYVVFGVLSLAFISSKTYFVSVFDYKLYQRYISFLILFYTVNTFVRSVDKGNKVIWIIMIALLINSFEAINQADIARGRYRAVGFFDDPNYFGSALLIGIGLAISVMSTSTKKYLQAAGGIILLICIFAVLKTMSRGVLVALAIMFLMYFIKSKLYKLNSKKNIAIILILIMGVFVIIKRSGRELFFIDKRIEETKVVEEGSGRQGTAGSTSDRYAILMAGLNMIKENPVFGVGVSRFKMEVFNYLDITEDLGRKYVAHNTYLSIAAEQGLIIFAVFLGIIIISVRDLQRIQRIASETGERALFTITYGMQLGFVGYLVSITFVSAENENFFWLPIFFTMALNRIIRERSIEYSKSMEIKHSQQEERRRFRYRDQKALSYK